MDSNNVAWQMSQLRRTKWLENDDPRNESGLTFAAHTSMSQVLDLLQPLLEAYCPQDISEFRISDKRDGEISFQWYGPVLELDLDVSADGEVSYLLCYPDAPRHHWLTKEDGTPADLESAMRSYLMDLTLALRCVVI